MPRWDTVRLNRGIKPLLYRKFHTPSENQEQTVIWGWGALAPVSERNGARAPHPHEIFGLQQELPFKNPP
jgi:hypothetical protein